MRTKNLWQALTLLVLIAMALSACASPAAPATTPAPAAETQAPAAETSAPAAEKFTIGMLLVGPYNDRGYSQAHYEGGEYAKSKMPGAELIYIDKVNPADRAGTTPDQLAEDLLSKGANVIIFNSDDMKDASNTFAKNHPEVPVIMASGDQQWAEGKAFQDHPNMINIMGRMEYGKMIAGCAAALTSQTGKIGYLGPLINDETRRLAASAYLGARHCWSEYLQKDPADLAFKVTWIGFWFNIPGVTSDPTQVADEFYNSGYDVVLSGIDTTEAVQEAKKMTDAGKKVWAIPYDFVGSCQEAPDICLGVPYFNWGPSYLKNFQAIQAGTWEPHFEWNGPDWADINNHDTSMIGYAKGDALSEEASAQLDQFIQAMAGGLNLWTGPINLQDGTAYLNEGEVATDQQIWYLPQLLEGMEGQSVPSS